MKLVTRNFGEIEIEDTKIVNFPKGIVGFPDLQNFTLINDSEKENSPIKWFQSIEEPQFAMPVIDPLLVKADFNPEVDNDKVSLIGEWESEDILVLVTITVPHDIEKMTVNLKGPFIINTKTMKAVQTIIEDDDYDIKFPIYGILKKMKEEAGK